MAKNSGIFDHDHPYTLGVEEEYMLCDPITGELINRVDEFMAALPQEYQSRFSYELILSELETNTSVCRSVTEALAEIVSLRKQVKIMGEKLGYRIGISGTHPTAVPGQQTFVANDSYNWVTDQMHYYAKQNITFSTHVHVAVPGAETAIHVCNALRRWIPPLLSISTNSPFFAGENTGMLSARTMQFGIFPRTNIPMKFENFAEYENHIELWHKTESIAKPRHVWWKIRPSLDFGTIEFRIFDVQRSLKKLELLIALSQALIYQSVQDYHTSSLIEDLSLELLNDGLWKALRFDFDKSLVDTGTDQVVKMRDFVNLLGEYCAPALQHFGNQGVLKTLDDIIRNGTEADEQLKVFHNDGLDKLKQFLMDSVEYTIGD